MEFTGVFLPTLSETKFKIDNSYLSIYACGIYDGCVTTAGEVYSSRAHIHTLGVSRVFVLSWVYKKCNIYSRRCQDYGLNDIWLTDDGGYFLPHYILNNVTVCLFIFQCGGRFLYLAWRVFWGLYHTVWIIMTGVDSDQWAGPDPNEQIKWFIYLTDWSYFMLTISSLFQLLCVVYVNVRRKDIIFGKYQTTKQNCGGCICF